MLGYGHASRRTALRSQPPERSAGQNHPSVLWICSPFCIFIHQIRSCLHNLHFWSLNEISEQQKALRASDLLPPLPIFPRSAGAKAAPRRGSRGHARHAAAPGCSARQREQAKHCARNKQAQQRLSQNNQCVPRSPPCFKEAGEQFFPTCKLHFQDETSRNPL